MSSRFQSAVFGSSIVYPNAVVWSEENLVAVACGNTVSILNPGNPGVRGVITIPSSKPFPLGVIDGRGADLINGCLLPCHLSQDNRPCARSISWSPAGLANNAGCLLAVCTTGGRVKLYRFPFCEFSVEWIEVSDISELLFNYYKSTGFGDCQIVSSESLDVIPGRDNADHECADEPLVSSLRKNQKRRRQNAAIVAEKDSDDSRQKSTWQIVPASFYKRKLQEKATEDRNLSLITMQQYASRNAMLMSLTIAWSPILGTSGNGVAIPHNSSSCCSILAIGGKCGRISFWRVHAYECYSIDKPRYSSKVSLVGLLKAHDTWVTSINWALYGPNASKTQFLLATGSSDGRVKIWRANGEELMKSSEVIHDSFSLLKEVMTVDSATISVLSLIVPSRSQWKLLLAIGKGSGSFEVWTIDMPTSKFEKVGCYNAHDRIVTGLAWAFDGRCLYSCSQDNSMKSWILVEDSLCEVPIPSNSPGLKASSDVPYVFDSCFGLAVSPGNLSIAVNCPQLYFIMSSGSLPLSPPKINCIYIYVLILPEASYSSTRLALTYRKPLARGFDVGLLNPMYQEGELIDFCLLVAYCFQRSVITHRAAVEFLWIGGQQLDLSSTTCEVIYNETFPGITEKELIWWETNILWSLNQYENLSRLLNIWDIVAALLAFKQSAPEYVERILLKWLTSYLRSQFGISVTVLPEVFKFLPKLSSRQLHLINIINRRVVLKECKQDNMSNKQKDLEGLGVIKDEQVNTWMELLLSSESELLERLVGFCFSAILNLLSNSSIEYFKVGCWSPDGLPQMEQWVSQNGKNVKDHTKFLAAEVGKVDKRRLLDIFGYEMDERCNFCSAVVSFESTENAICSGVNYDNGVSQRHKLERCAITLRILPTKPSWYCMCCHRRAIKLAPSILFTMLGYPSDFESFVESSAYKNSSTPCCPFCGILLQRSQPEYSLSPSPV
ncbi:hypothetical protein DH2020_009757 [Rehmannia glutinosa]|uniref:Transcription factor IIIC 90kDa subunit N-terminal domain-containing protein n=1 Tax=Rehmannia glutinosa TaxID=99300 RepID=A0ABR0X9P2_REHGL